MARSANRRDPYGKTLRQYRPCTTPRYLSTHHERDQATGYDNRGARLYDSEIGRFLGVDPLAGKFAAWSPYNYVFGNPVSLVDPDGRTPESPPGIGFLLAYHANQLNDSGHPFLAGMFDAFAGTDPIYVNYNQVVSTVNAETDWELFQALDPTGFSSIPDLIDAAVDGDERAQGQLAGGVVIVVLGARTGVGKVSRVKGPNPYLGKSTSELGRAKSSFRSLVREHKQKLKDYKRNPDSHDNKGTLANASPSVRKKIIDGRIKKLKRDIKKQKQELRKVKEALRDSKRNSQ